MVVAKHGRIERAQHCEAAGEVIHVRGLVQGVGFRPNVWRLAIDCGLSGEVWNDAGGVVIRVWGAARDRQRFLKRLRDEAPPLACVDVVETEPATEEAPRSGFHIVASHAGHVHVHTGVVPDAASCSECLADATDPCNHRFRYPFTNCTHCGPRLSIVRGIPYDRVHTSMAEFVMCPDCQAEYDDPANRRFHAQPNACPVCGPRLTLEDADGPVESVDALDEIDATCALLEAGRIVAIKGIGGFQLAVDACNAAAVQRLRARKRRDHKPFALMAPNLDTIRRYCAVDAKEQKLLESRSAPIVILQASGPERVAPEVAPGIGTLGFMLPYTPLHHLLMQGLDRPIVLSSGNLSAEPQCTGNDEARNKLALLADRFLAHDRAIINRVDDSVARVVAGAPRLLRRARGYAPASIPLPEGFSEAPPLLAMGGELKNTFCLLQDGQAVVSQHMGDLEDAATHADYRHNLMLYQQLFRHRPKIVVVDSHPEYLSTKLGRERAEQNGLAVIAVQHHHAHIASCLVENDVALDAGPVLGIALDGLGYGQDGTFWGGEFLLADYRGFERLGHLRALPMMGGKQAIREPWRSTYAHLRAALGWRRFSADYPALALRAFLDTRPLKTLEAMLERGLNSPLASSCGRLFDAVAAAVGIRREHATYEGQAAIELEACIDALALAAAAGDAYPFAIVTDGTGTVLDSAPMWPALLDDLARKTATATMAARFHVGLAGAVVDMSLTLASRLERRVNAVALSGGVFQNRILFERVHTGLRERGFTVLTQAKVPANDGGLALGQAAIGAARSLARRTEGEVSACA